MRILALLLIAILAVGGVVDACAEAHADHADLACLDDCCQPVYSAGPSPDIVAVLAVCERLLFAASCQNDESLARSHFRPPKCA